MSAKVHAPGTPSRDVRLLSVRPMRVALVAHACLTLAIPAATAVPVGPACADMVGGGGVCAWLDASEASAWMRACALAAPCGSVAAGPDGVEACHDPTPKGPSTCFVAPQAPRCIGSYGQVLACASAQPQGPGATAGACVLAPCVFAGVDEGGAEVCFGLTPNGPPFCAPRMLP